MPAGAGHQQLKAPQFRQPTDAELDLLVVLAQKIQERFPSGLPTWSPEKVETVAVAMLDTHPDIGPVDPLIGPAFTTGALARYWKRSPEWIRKEARAGRLLALKGTNGYLFPAFQFDTDGNVLPGLHEVVQAVSAHASDAGDIARWLATRPSRPSPIQLLQTGDIAGALERAHERAAAGPANQTSPAPS